MDRGPDTRLSRSSVAASEGEPLRGEVIRPPQDQPADDEKVMSLVEHLTELRRRIVIAVLAVAIGTVVGFAVAPQVIALLKAPIPGVLHFRQPGSAFFLQLKLGLMLGVAFATPMILYQFWAFVSPGLTPRERRLARPWVPLALFFLLVGIGLAYVILPLTVGFLLSFQIPGVLEPLLFAEDYFGFVTTMFLAFGLVMEFPVFLVLLAKVGLVHAERLRRARRYVVLGIIVFAVVVTPGGDPISPLIMAAVMYPIYELTILLVGRSRTAQASDG